MNVSSLRLAIGVVVLGACAAQSAMADNVSISINQPGVYGRVNIGEPVPQAAWVNARPMVITQSPMAAQRQPIYLYVPPAQSSNWSRYCGRYGACAQPVIFVQDRWVRDRHAQARHGRDRDHDGVVNAHDRDRDGDGVRNSRDRRPNNPNYR
jgi:hypothetical protein